MGALNRALDNRKNLMIIRDNFSYFSIKSHVVTSHLNHLIETVHMTYHKICFDLE